MTPEAVPGRWRTSTSPATETRRPLGSSASRAASTMRARRELAAQEGDRVRLQRQRQRAVVVHHVLAELHLRQRHLLLAHQIGAGARGGEERQALGGGAGVERAHLPERGAAVEPERAERVGFGEPLEAGARDAGAQPEIAHGFVCGVARRHETLRIGLAKAFDLAEAKADGVRRCGCGGPVPPSVGEGHGSPPPLWGRVGRGCQNVVRCGDAPPPTLPHEGEGEPRALSKVESQSEKFTSTSRISTPCSRASRTSCAGA